ncbi:MAG: acetylxylan esterase [Afipia sp. 62-7]|mgnify:CR=1 FL=1|nr:MAG: acetylxylan esterase [Afipia sp. 62-7]
MRTDIEFNADGTILRGWHYVPDQGQGPFPTVIMAHGSAALKEQYLDRYAEVFAAAGLASIVYDHRNFGASDGNVRQEIDPVLQMRDYRNAITFALTLPNVDPDRIGAWGTSLSGGHVLMLAALDGRGKCVVAQVPPISGGAGALRRTRADHMAASRARFDEDRKNRFAGKPPGTMPLVAQDPTVACFNGGADAWEFFQESLKVAPNRKNEVTLRSAEMLREYEPGSYIERISPTPLLMIVGNRDVLTATDLALQAYNRALEPKKLVLFEGGHYDPYVKLFSISSSAARDWFVTHLLN